MGCLPTADFCAPLDYINDRRTSVIMQLPFHWCVVRGPASVARGKVGGQHTPVNDALVLRGLPLGTGIFPSTCMNKGRISRKKELNI